MVGISKLAAAILFGASVVSTIPLLLGVATSLSHPLHALESQAVVSAGPIGQRMLYAARILRHERYAIMGSQLCTLTNMLSTLVFFSALVMQNGGKLSGPYVSFVDDFRYIVYSIDTAVNA